MKKFTILFLVLTFSILGFITGCGDDENGGTTGPSIDPDDYAYYMVVSGIDYQRSDYIISIIPMGNNIITSMEISVNGVDVLMTNYMDMWSGIALMDEGQTYQVEAVINGNDYSFSIVTTYIPEVNWPNIWNFTEPTPITWSLESNAEYQDFYATATNYSTWDDNFSELNPSDRSFTIPENWVDPLLTDYSLMLMEMNFSFKDNLIVSCMSADEAFYIQGRLNGKSKHNLIEISKDMYKRIFNQ